MKNPSKNHFRSAIFINEIINKTGKQACLVIISITSFFILSTSTVGAQSVAFYTSGNWTCPTGITSITVELWGAGGAGGSVNLPGNQAASGGGGGEYTKKTLTVIPGNVYPVTVGVGGVSDANSILRKDGTASFFNTSVYSMTSSSAFAKGGTGGGCNGDNHGSSQPGAGQTKNGGNGTDGAFPWSGAGGACAGSGGNAQNASGTTGGAATCGGGGKGGNGVTWNSRGMDGDFVGGGGSGACKSDNNSYAGGSGGNGLVVITYGAATNISFTINPVIPSDICVGSSFTIPGVNFADIQNVYVGTTPVTSFSYTPTLITALAGTVSSGLISVVANNGIAYGCKSISVNPLPVATLTGTTSVCQGSLAPGITFSGITGQAPFTFYYRLNGGAIQSISTSTGNTVTIPQSTTSAGSFTYTLESISDSRSCSQSQGGARRLRSFPPRLQEWYREQQPCAPMQTQDRFLYRAIPET